LRDFVSVGARPFYAFTIGVIVNIALGFVLSTQVFERFLESAVVTRCLRYIPRLPDLPAFRAPPPALEAALAGLASLSSGYASVRSDDGLCTAHQRLVAASAICRSHRPR
jgi:hypothetical protein